jgi:hypothetical protein
MGMTLAAKRPAGCPLPMRHGAILAATITQMYFIVASHSSAKQLGAEPGQKLEKSNKILENVKSIRAGLL